MRKRILTISWVKNDDWSRWWWWWWWLRVGWILLRAPVTCAAYEAWLLKLIPDRIRKTC